MAESLTYTSLLSDVQIYAERDDAPFVDQIPRFVMLAENRLASEARGLGYQRYVTSTLTMQDTIEKPARWRETISIRAGTVFLHPRTLEYCKMYAADEPIGTPRYYADYGYEHYFFAPSISAEIEIAYYERPEPLSASNEVNWTTQYAPQLLLYATLLEAQPFLKRPERTQEFQALYDRALQGLAQESTRRISGDRAATSRTGE